MAGGSYTLKLQFRCEHAPPASGLTSAACLLLETRSSDGWSGAWLSFIHLTNPSYDRSRETFAQK